MAAVGLVLLIAGCGAGKEADEPPPAPAPVARPVAADMAKLVSGFDTFGLDQLAAPTHRRPRRRPRADQPDRRRPDGRQDHRTVPRRVDHCRHPAGADQRGLLKAELGYAEGPGYQVVTLPCRGGKLAFSVIVPAAVDTLRLKGIAAVLDEVRPASVTLAMPRFTARSTLELSETLRAAGMPAAFSAAADFSGITDDTDLYIDSLRHKTFVQVDEKGTEAAAASGADVQAASAKVGSTVTVDRPVLFVITDTTTGAPLFLGRISDPTSETGR